MAHSSSTANASPWQAVLVAAAAAIVLVPYATVGLPHRLSLYGQAASILVVVLAILTAGLLHGGWRPRLLAYPRRPLVAAALYSGAALLGAAVGLARGNGVELVSGQLLSMGLLPLGLAAAVVAPAPAPLRACSRGIAGAVAAAATAHLLHWILSAARGSPPERLFFAGRISASGPTLAGALFLLALTASPAPLRRRVAWAGLGLTSLYVLGSGIRGLWLAVLIGAGILFVLSPRLRGREGAAPKLAAVAAVAAIGLLSVSLWRERPRHDLMPSSDLETLATAARAGLLLSPVEGEGDRILSWARTPEQRGWVISPPFLLPGPGTYRLRAVVRGGGTGGAWVGLQWMGEEGERRGELQARARPARRRWLRVEAYGAPAPGTHRARVVVGCSPDSSGQWSLRRVEVVRLGPSALAPFLTQLSYLEQRTASLVRPTALGDRSLTLRRRETMRLAELFGQSPWLLKLFGQGLGAVFPLEGFGFDDQGRLRPISEANYVHNFYMFLLYKLGAVGSALVLIALAIWTACLVHGARGLRSEPRERAVAAALAAAWIAYCLWSVASPAILDFRVSPLLGLLLGSVGARSGSRLLRTPGDPPPTCER